MEHRIALFTPLSNPHILSPSESAIVWLNHVKIHVKSPRNDDVILQVAQNLKVYHMYYNRNAIAWDAYKII